MNNEQAQMEAATKGAADLARRSGGAVQAASSLLRQQAANALHPRARKYCAQAADLVDYIAKQPNCTLKTDHGMIVTFVLGMLNDPTAAPAFLAAIPQLTSIAQTVDGLAKHGRTVRPPPWLMTTSTGQVTVDPAIASTEPTFFNDEARESYEKNADPEAAGRAAYRAGQPRTANPLTVAGGRAAWTAGWDAELAAEEGTAPAKPAPAPATPPAGNRAQRRAKKKEGTP